jgi:flagellar basal-body rod protein FlgC
VSGFYSTVEIAASGLSAERLAMDVIANNIANVNTTRTPQGGAFKRQLVVFAEKPGTTPAPATSGFNAFGGSFSSNATDATNGASSDSPDSDNSAAAANANGVEAVGIAADPSPDRLVFDPGNPQADARGYVHYPNVQMVNEMVDLMAATRAYEANVAVIQASKTMDTNTAGLLGS